MSGFTDFSSDLQQLKTQISSNVAQVVNLSGQQRQEKCRSIENDFNTIDETVKQIKEEMIMWEPGEKSKMGRILQDTDVEIQRLRSRYREAQDRESLFAGAANLDGSGMAQRESLVGQRQQIEKGGSMIQSFNQNISDIQDVGTGILTEMSRQKSTISGIDGKLDDLGTEINVGEKTTDRMLCRQKKQTAIVWIIIVIVVIVFLSVFLYFVFKP